MPKPTKEEIDKVREEMRIMILEICELEELSESDPEGGHEGTSTIKSLPTQPGPASRGPRGVQKKIGYLSQYT